MAALPPARTMPASGDSRPVTHPPDPDLQRHFAPIFRRIAEGSVEREAERILAHEPIAWLREARFGALRVPREAGGLGASVEALFDLLMDLAAADSNLPQALRAHFGFVERLYAEVDPALHAPWLRRVAEGAIFGNATTETGSAVVGTLDTRLYRSDGQWLLDGEKFYSTGSLYADWIAVAAQQQHEDGGSERVMALVPADAIGLTRVDDWRGFGQRLSASGSTRFERTPVEADQVLPSPRTGPTPMTAFFQLVHLATLAGIARAIESDAVAYVQARRRVYSHGAGVLPKDDPQVQQLVGQLASTAFATAATVRAVAALLGEIDRRRTAGEAPSEEQWVQVELATAKAQLFIGDAVLEAATRLFDVGGATALQEDRKLDRHWRNARTLASHNPAMHKARRVGQHALSGVAPPFYWSVGTAA